MCIIFGFFCEFSAVQVIVHVHVYIPSAVASRANSLPKVFEALPLSDRTLLEPNPVQSGAEIPAGQGGN